MSHQNEGFVLSQLFQTLFVNFACDFGVDCGNGVVENENIAISVECACECEARLLSSRKSDALFAHHRRVAMLQNLEIGDKARLFNDVIIPLLIEGYSEENIVADGVGKDDGFLLDIGDFSLHSKVP